MNEMNDQFYTLLPNLMAEMPDIPQNGILSRTVFKSDTVKAILFAFDAGQELSEHTSSHAAILHFLQGEASLTLGDDVQEVSANAWVHMQANLPHGILAKSPVVMLLLLLEST